MHFDSLAKNISSDTRHSFCSIYLSLISDLIKTRSLHITKRKTLLISYQKSLTNSYQKNLAESSVAVQMHAAVSATLQAMCHRAMATLQALAMCHRALPTVQAPAMCHRAMATAQALAMCHLAIACVQAHAMCHCKKVSRVDVHTSGVPHASCLLSL